MGAAVATTTGAAAVVGMTTPAAEAATEGTSALVYEEKALLWVPSCSMCSAPVSSSSVAATASSVIWLIVLRYFST